jgi:CheY-like chemotaxis protein
MSRALLLSPDDQAVSAITGVLEEMSVSCERPLDGASAALKLNSHNFDLVLVDCENLPAAKLIFDVCRRGQGGNTPVPIAIVDGRAGLPTAFRLGADLILTKPVSKDNARTTIRTAMGRVKKDEPAAAAAPAAEEASSTAASAPAEEKAMAAAAGVTSGPTAPISAVQESAPAAPIKAEAASVVQMSPTVKEAPTAKILFSSEVAPSRVVRRPLEILPGLKAEPEEKLSDDPVLAEIDKSDNAVVPVPAAVTPAPKAAPAKAAKKSSGPVVLLALILAGGGCYAAWMYSPAFRAVIGPQVDGVMALVGRNQPANAHPQSKAPAPAQVAPKAATAVAPQAATASTSPTNAASANDANVAPSTTVVNSTSPSAPVATPAAAAPSKNPPAPTVKKVAASVPVVESVDTDENSGKVITLDNPPVMEKNIVILSSKGAEKRLDHKVAPVYPKDAKDGSVVMKAVISETGKVADVTLVQGDPNLAPEVMRAVKQWHYKPYARGGKNLAFQTIVMVEHQK